MPAPDASGLSWRDVEDCLCSKLSRCKETLKACTEDGSFLTSITGLAMKACTEDGSLKLAFCKVWLGQWILFLSTSSRVESWGLGCYIKVASIGHMG